MLVGLYKWRASADGLTMEAKLSESIPTPPGFANSFANAGLISHSLVSPTSRALDQEACNDSNPATPYYILPLLYSTLLYSTLLYSTLLYSTLLYSTLLYSTLLYSTLYSTKLCHTLTCSNVLHCILLILDHTVLCSASKTEDLKDLLPDLAGVAAGTEPGILALEAAGFLTSTEWCWTLCQTHWKVGG